MRQYSLYVIADCSGSMAESGKARVLAYLLSYVAECLRLQQLPAWCATVHALAWAATIQPLALPVERDLPPLNPEGSADTSVLMDAVEKLMADAHAPLRILLLSDGGIDHAAQKSWQAWRARFPIEVRAVAVGADASRPALEAMVADKGLFDAEDIGMAMQDWEIPHPAPIFMADAQQDK